MQKRLLPAYLLTFVNILGFSILMPVLPFVVDSYHAPKWIYGLLLTLYSLFQFIGAPYLGAMSDRIGRKPVLIISQTGTLLSWLVFIGAIFIPQEYQLFGFALSIFIIGVSRILDGITGGNISVANAYVADITSKEEKSYIFGYLGGITGLGMIIGPGLGGISASSSLGYVGTLIVSIAISIITLVCIFLWLKESHPQDLRNPQKKQSIIQTLAFRKRLKELNPEPIIKQLFVMKFFISALMAFYVSTIALYLIDLFDFNEEQLGYFMFVVGIFLAFNQAVLSKFFVKKIGEMKTLVLGISLSILGLVSITLTKDLFLFIAFYYVMNLGISLTFPMFSALISIHADPEKQGQTMGMSDSISSFAMALFPVVAASIYGVMGKNIYYLMIAFPVGALIVAFSCFKKVNPK